MRRMKILSGILAACLLMLAVPAATAAPGDAAYEIGASVGIWFSGTITVEGYDADKDGSFLLRLFADMYVAPKFAIGAYINYSPAEVEGVNGTAMEFGMGIKPRFFVSPEISVKPGLNIGYRNTDIEDMDDPVDGLAVNLSVEFQYHMADSAVIPFLDVGFLSQPTGGNEYADVTWAPIFYLNVGAAYGF